MKKVFVVGKINEFMQLLIQTPLKLTTGNWYHFNIESVEEGTINIEFVTLSENNSTKNVNQETYEQHLNKNLADIEEDYGN